MYIYTHVHVYICIDTICSLFTFFVTAYIVSIFWYCKNLILGSSPSARENAAARSSYLYRSHRNIDVRIYTYMHSWHGQHDKQKQMSLDSMYICIDIYRYTYCITWIACEFISTVFCMYTCTYNSFIYVGMNFSESNLELNAAMVTIFIATRNVYKNIYEWYWYKYICIHIIIFMNLKSKQYKNKKICHSYIIPYQIFLCVKKIVDLKLDIIFFLFFSFVYLSS